MAHYDDNAKSAVIAQKLGFTRTCDFTFKGRFVVGYEQLNPTLV
jgi:hypothetical protein